MFTINNSSTEAVRRRRRGAFYIDKPKTKIKRKGDFIMANSKEELKLIRMNEVEATAIN